MNDGSLEYDQHNMSSGFYNESGIQDLLENDKLEPGEAAFMMGYIAEMEKSGGKI